MVSLIEKTSYLEEIKDKLKLFSFYKLLINEPVLEKVSDELFEIDRFHFNFIKSFQENDKQHFSEFYNQFSKRKPTSESNWIHNDILLFIIICGLVKYNLNKEWISKVVSLRPNSSKLNKSVNLTFNNLINANYNSRDNLFEIIIVFLHLVNLPQLSNDFLNTAYLSVSEKFNQEYANHDFSRLVALRAFDIIILSKDSPASTEIFKLRNFKTEFLKRTSLLRDIIYFSLVIILFVLNFYLIKTSEDFKNYLNDISVLLGLFGIGLVVAFKWIRLFIGWILFKSLGFYKYYKDEANSSLKK